MDNVAVSLDDVVEFKRKESGMMGLMGPPKPKLKRLKVIGIGADETGSVQVEKQIPTPCTPKPKLVAKPKHMYKPKPQPKGLASFSRLRSNLLLCDDHVGFFQTAKVSKKKPRLLSVQ